MLPGIKKRVVRKNLAIQKMGVPTTVAALNRNPHTYYTNMMGYTYVNDL